jgi:ADP-ribose pyrophosphatase
MDDGHLRERTVASRLIHQGRYLTFRIDTVEDAGGRRHEREVVGHPGAVAILALADAAVLMVRQFRAAAGCVLLELPAGTLDREADGTTEDPSAAAARELAEETGYRAATWRHLARFFTAPGFTDERMDLFLATDLEPIEGYAGPDADERLDLERVPWQDALAMVEHGDIRDAKTLIGLLRLARLIEGGLLGSPPAG